MNPAPAKPQAKKDMPIPTNADTMPVMLKRSSMILSAAVMTATLVGHAETAAAGDGGTADGLVDHDRHLFQRPPSPVTRVRDLEPVEQRVADVDPLAASIRQIETGLRQPTGFEQVYRVPGDDEHFMRIDGGLYAVFPRSVYTNRRFGELPLIPANTVFSIGPPQFLMRDAKPEPRNEAAEAMRREFAITADSFHVTPQFMSSALQTESLRIDDRIEDMPAYERRRPALHVDGNQPRQESLVDYRRRLQRSDDRLNRGRTVDAEAAAEREQFRQRMHELLGRAAAAESNGR